MGIKGQPKEALNKEKNTRLYYRELQLLLQYIIPVLKISIFIFNPKQGSYNGKSLLTLAVSIIYYPLHLSLPIKSHIIIKKANFCRIENCSLALPYLRHTSSTTAFSHQ